MQSVVKLIPILFILLTLLIPYLMEKLEEKTIIRVPANQTHVIKMYAMTTSSSEIHYKVKNCQIKSFMEM